MLLDELGVWVVSTGSWYRELFLPFDLGYTCPLPDVFSVLIQPCFPLEVEYGAEIEACVIHCLIGALRLRGFRQAACVVGP